MTVRYAPFNDAEFRLRMGVRRLDPRQWVEVDELREEQLALKASLVAERGDEVVMVLDDPRVTAAASELLDLLVHHLRHDHGIGLTPGDRHPIVEAALGTQEDWALMMRRPSDRGAGTHPVLAAACVCFPTRWVLADKRGLTSMAMHAPVDQYAEQLSQPVDRFFDRLRVDSPMWRLNWNLFDCPDLFQPSRPPTTAPVAADEVGERVMLRVERQTLRRLEESGAIAFGIRVHQWPLEMLDGDQRRRLAASVRSMTPEAMRYKSVDLIEAPLLDWLDRSA